MMKIRIRQLSNGLFRVRWSWHWWGSENAMTYVNEKDCSEFVTKLLGQAAEHYQFEKSRCIQDTV